MPDQPPPRPARTEQVRLAGSRFSRHVADQYDSFRSLPLQVTEAIHDRIEAATGLRPGAAVLELGAGTGRIARAFLRKGYAYTAVDASPAMLAQLRLLAGRSGPANPVLASVTHLPFPAACFDLVLAVQVFGVVPDWQQALRECARVVRPGGPVVLGRLERAADSMHALLRRERNRLLRQEGLEHGRPGGEEAEVQAELSRLTGASRSLPPICWEMEHSPRAAVLANLSGWQVQSLPTGQRSELTERLLRFAAGRWGEVDLPRREEACFVLHVFRR